MEREENMIYCSICHKPLMKGYQTSVVVCKDCASNYVQPHFEDVLSEDDYYWWNDV